MAQYRALEAFAQFGSELDRESQKQLARGARVVEILKQPQYRPVPVERQVVAIWVGTGGYLDDLPVEDAKRFTDEFIEHLAARTDLLDSIRDTGELSDEAGGALAGPRGLHADLRAVGRRGGERGRRGPGRAEGPGQGGRRVGSPLLGRRRGRAPGLGRLAIHGGAAPRRPPADPFGPVDDEDHPCDGAHRRVADREGAAARDGGSSLRRPAHRCDGGRGPADGLDRPSAARGTRDPVARRRARHDRDRGLAGAFNANLLKRAEGLLRRVRSRGSNPSSTSRGRRRSGTSGSGG